MNCPTHKPIAGFGGMGDAWICIDCGLCKYPEVFPRNHLPPILENNPKWKALSRLALAARSKREISR
jgi:hypothetical protein